MEPQGLIAKNPANVDSGKFIHNYSRFDNSLSYRKWNTVRFGEYTPTFEMEGVESDSIQVNTQDIIDSLSLNAPFKGRIRKVKESFKIPFQAILPRNWDNIYVQPSNGDDTPRNANTVIENFPLLMKNLFLLLHEILSVSLEQSLPSPPEAKGETRDEPSAFIAGWLSALVRFLVLGEYVYSHGSLLNVCGYKASAQFDGFIPGVGRVSYDKIFDAVISKVFSKVTSFFVSFPQNDGVAVKSQMFAGLSGENITVKHASFRRFLEMMRENPLGEISASNFKINMIVEGTAETMDYDGFTQFVYDSLFDSDEGILNITDNWFVLPENSSDGNPFDYDSDVTALNPTILNYSRLAAYQIVCAHFYSNSSLDAVYSAELARQYIGSCFRLLSPLMDTYDVPLVFERNGIEMMYDDFSGNFVRFLLFGCITDIDSDDALLAQSMAVLYSPATSLWAPGFWSAWSFLFGFRKSLRFGDYFVCSRPRPLAPINTDVSVNNSAVSVVDITRNIQAQRFANSVMRTRQKIEDYVKGLFGKAPAPDYHNPFYLTREIDFVFGDAVQNTAETQATDPNSRTANFASNLGRYTFTFENDDMHPCIYMQIIFFDIKRAYTRSVDRHFLHADRFDMFNPDFQYIGDQAVYGIELGYSNETIFDKHFPFIFGYQTRDMEYKQRFDVASGGFVENLPGWCLTDQDQSKELNFHLNSDFIRSYNTELDQFFLSLSGFSLGSYFHFICITDNNVDARRPMAVDPQILA